MISLNITIKQDKKSPRKTVVEFNIDQFEKLAAVFGFFNPEIIERLDKAEKDIVAGRIRKINSLKDLR